MSLKGYIHTCTYIEFYWSDRYHSGQATHIYIVKRVDTLIFEFFVWKSSKPLHI